MEAMPAPLTIHIPKKLLKTKEDDFLFDNGHEKKRLIDSNFDDSPNGGSEKKLEGTGASAPPPIINLLQIKSGIPVADSKEEEKKVIAFQELELEEENEETLLAYIISFQLGVIKFPSKKSGYVTLRVYYGKGGKEKKTQQSKILKNIAQVNIKQRFEFVFTLENEPTHADIQFTFKTFSPMKSPPTSTIRLEIQWDQLSEWKWCCNREFKKDNSLDDKVKGTLDFQFCCRTLKNTVFDKRLWDYGQCRCAVVCIITATKGFKNLNEEKESYVEVSFGAKRYATSATKGDANWRQRCHFWIKDFHVDSGTDSILLTVKEDEKEIGKAEAKFSFPDVIPTSGHFEIENWISVAGKDGKPFGKLKVALRFFSKLILEQRYQSSLLDHFRRETGVRDDPTLSRVEAGYFMGLYGAMSFEGVKFALNTLGGAMNEVDGEELLNFLSEARGYLSSGVPEYIMTHPARIFSSINVMKQALNNGQDTTPCRHLLNHHEFDEIVPNYILGAMTSIAHNPDNIDGSVSELLKIVSKANLVFQEEKDVELEQYMIKQIIDLYGVDTIKPSDYQSFNEFFSRHEDKEIQHGDDDRFACSPADCRMLVYESIENAQEAWVKGKEFNLDNLLGKFSKKYSKLFEKCSICFCRLTPIDAHRWYLPVSGVIEETLEIKGGLLPDLPAAIKNQHCNVYTSNRRSISIIKSQNFGTVILIAIGSVFVGSVVLLIKNKVLHKQGTAHGTFHHGGSTIILLFQSDRIKFLPQLLLNTTSGIESYTEYGLTIGFACEDSESVTL